MAFSKEEEPQEPSLKSDVPLLLSKLRYTRAHKGGWISFGEMDNQASIVASKRDRRKRQRSCFKQTRKDKAEEEADAEGRAGEMDRKTYDAKQ